MKNVLRAIWLAVPGSLFFEPRRSLPDDSSSNRDEFTHRRLKIAIWFSTSIGLLVALAASLALAVADRDPDFLVVAAPFGFAYAFWRAAGFAWLYWTYRHATWSLEYMRIWWRVTGRRGPD